MSILNLTPDSFSGDGISTVTQALKQAEQMLESGADILDLGAESSRPGSSEISPQEEQKRLLPALKAIKKEFNTLISIDTWRAETATLAMEEGADWINSIWGIKKDPELIEVVKKYQAKLIIMHNTSDKALTKSSERLGSYYEDSTHSNLIDEILSNLTTQIQQSGLKKDQIIIDPGLGFGKTVSENLQIMRNLSTFKETGFKVLIGASRKSFIGHTLDLPVTERLEGSLACASVAIMQEIDIIRVHDVKETFRISKMISAIKT